MITDKEYLVHMTHCNLGENFGSCKYGEDSQCPALNSPDGNYTEADKERDLRAVYHIIGLLLEETKYLKDGITKHNIRYHAAIAREWIGRHVKNVKNP